MVRHLSAVSGASPVRNADDGRLVELGRRLPVEVVDRPPRAEACGHAPGGGGVEDSPRLAAAHAAGCGSRAGGGGNSPSMARTVLSTLEAAASSASRVAKRTAWHAFLHLAFGSFVSTPCGGALGCTRPSSSPALAEAASILTCLYTRNNTRTLCVPH